MDSTTVENKMNVPQNSSGRTVTQCSASASGKMPKGDENKTSTEICTPTFITALFTRANIWKQPKCPSKKGVVHTQWTITQP